MKYNWQQKDWTVFKFKLDEVEQYLFAFAEETGHMTGLLKGMSESLQMDALVNVMVVEAIKTSEIEGQFFSRKDVVSSIRNNLGLNNKANIIKDKKAQGIGALMVEARNSFAEPLTQDTLFHWHKLIFNGVDNIGVGKWRSHSEPMQVISGAIGKEKIHFEAPPSKSISVEMKKFINWFNQTAPNGTNEIRNAPIRSAIAHLYFESIHPFEDGNGRIGRAIAEKTLSQTIGRPVLLSLSKVIEADKKSYYNALETAQRSNNITGWLNYFIPIILKAQTDARMLVDFTLRKVNFFDKFNTCISERQLKVINKMLDAEPEGFEGGMSAKKYQSITKSSKATATRDLQQLAENGVLTLHGGGRSIHYLLNF